MTDGTRTHDDWNHNPGLYQLSYGHRRDQRFDLLAEQKQDYSDVFIALPTLFSFLRNISSLACTIDARHRHLTRRTLVAERRLLHIACHAATIDCTSSRSENAPARSWARASSNALTPAFKRFGSDSTRRHPRAPGTPRYRPSA